MNKSFLLAAAILAGAALAEDLPPSTIEELPPGKGPKIIEQSCSRCHGLEYISGSNKSAELWRETIEKMVGKGSTIAADEQEVLVDYLVKYFGPVVNVNKADAKELQTELELTPEEAAAVVKFRQESGGIKRWADMAKVSGLDVKKLEPRRWRLEYAN